MGFFDKNLKNWTSVIQNRNDENSLICKYPEENFNNNSTLIVAPSEEAIFINNGVIEQIFSSGTYNLSTQNYPFISDLRNSFSGNKSSFTCSVYFINKAHTMEIKWGTDSPIQLRDPVLHIMTKIVSRGAYKIKIENSSLFLVKLLGSNINLFKQIEINNYFINEFQQHIKSCITSSVLELNKEILGINAYQTIIAENITPKLQKILKEYGINLISFSIAGIDILDEDEARQKLENAFANKKVMDILGHDWTRQQSTEILHSAAANEGGIAGIGAALGLGLSAGSTIQNISKEILQPNQNVINCPMCNCQINNNAKFCPECGYEITSVKYCKNCGQKISPNAKFCQNCGFKQNEE